MYLRSEVAMIVDGKLQLDNVKLEITGPEADQIIGTMLSPTYVSTPPGESEIGKGTLSSRKKTPRHTAGRRKRLKQDWKSPPSMLRTSASATKMNREVKFACRRVPASPLRGRIYSFTGSEVKIKRWAPRSPFIVDRHRPV